MPRTSVQTTTAASLYQLPYRHDLLALSLCSELLPDPTAAASRSCSSGTPSCTLFKSKGFATVFRTTYGSLFVTPSLR